MSTLLDIKDLEIRYNTDEGVVYALNKVSLQLNEKETIGLVGETGAGKTTLARGVVRLVPQPPGEIMGGEVFYNGVDLLKISEAEMRKIRGAEISMIFQDPMTSLNPVMTVGEQIKEVIETHNRLSEGEAKKLAGDMLEKVGIPRERYFEYPHQFSGGMKQRVIIAIAIACNPRLLIADEPTTALDVTIQAQVLKLMNELKETLNTAMILITHDLGVVAQNCDKVAIIYAGEVVEFGTVHQVFKSMKHPYTYGLFQSIPKINEDTRRLHSIRGLMPDPTIWLEGCKFSSRCPYADERCTSQNPELRDLGDQHLCKCFKAEEWQAEEPSNE